MDYAGAAIIAGSILGVSLAPVLIFLVVQAIKNLRRRRQEPSHVSGTEPMGDPALRAALAAERDAKRVEHIAWDTEFMRLQGAPIPSAGDPYDLVNDMQAFNQWASGGHQRHQYIWQEPDIMQGGKHNNRPDCVCEVCNQIREQFFRQGA